MANKRKRENEEGKQKKIPRTEEPDLAPASTIDARTPAEEPDQRWQYLPLELKYKIAWESNYKDLLNLCKTSKEAFEGICGDNWFWKKKTKYDFGDLYNIEPIIIKDPYGDFQKDWWKTYQHYRSVFSKEFVKDLYFRSSSSKAGLKDIMKVIDERGFLIVDETDEDGLTALMLASLRGHADIVQFLLDEERANPNLADRNGNTALIDASRYGYTDIVKMLIKAGANPNLADVRGETALIAAADPGYGDIVKILLENEANPDLADGPRGPALNLASRRGHTSIVKMLLEAGANPNSEDYWTRETALMEASEKGHTDIVEMLLKARADPNLTDEVGRTALGFASEKGHTDIVDMLLKSGANPYS